MTQIIQRWVTSATTQNILYTSEFLLAMQFPTTCCGVMQGKFGKGTGKEYWTTRAGPTFDQSDQIGCQAGQNLLSLEPIQTSFPGVCSPQSSQSSGRYLKACR